MPVAHYGPDPCESQPTVPNGPRSAGVSPPKPQGRAAAARPRLPPAFPLSTRDGAQSRWRAAPEFPLSPGCALWLPRCQTTATKVRNNRERRERHKAPARRAGLRTRGADRPADTVQGARRAAERGLRRGTCGERLGASGQPGRAPPHAPPKGTGAGGDTHAPLPVPASSAPRLRSPAAVRSTPPPHLSSERAAAGPGCRARAGAGGRPRPNGAAGAFPPPSPPLLAGPAPVPPSPAGLPTVRGEAVEGGGGVTHRGPRGRAWPLPPRRSRRFLLPSADKMAAAGSAPAPPAPPRPAARTLRTGPPTA